MKKIAVFLPVLALLVAGSVSAHVSVKPNQVGVGAFQTFTVSVPTEKDVATVGVRLVMPEGLEHVSPTVKPGWTIRLAEEEGLGETGEADHEATVIKEITWTSGNIPEHFRDEFTFSAKVPATESTLMWKAYQTYRDGSVVSWELGPDQAQPKLEDGDEDYSQFGPASMTKVVDDLKAKQSSDQSMAIQTEKMKRSINASETAKVLSIIAVLVSFVAIYLARKKG